MSILFLQIIIFSSLAGLIYLYAKNTLLRHPEQGEIISSLQNKQKKDLIFLEKLDKLANSIKEISFRRLKIISSKIDNFFRNKLENLKNNNNNHRHH